MLITIITQLFIAIGTLCSFGLGSQQIKCSPCYCSCREAVHLSGVVQTIRQKLVHPNLANKCPRDLTVCEEQLQITKAMKQGECSIGRRKFWRVLFYFTRQQRMGGVGRRELVTGPRRGSPHSCYIQSLLVRRFLVRSIFKIKITNYITEYNESLGTLKTSYVHCTRSLHGSSRGLFIHYDAHQTAPPPPP